VKDMSLPFYNAWRTVSPITPSEYWKENYQKLVDEKFENSPTIKTVKHNGIDIIVRVVGKFNTEALTRKNDDYQKIIFKDYDYVVNVGDLFEFDDLKWICTDVSSTAVTKSCSVQLCNNTLSFYSTTDSSLHQIPCIITNKLTIKEDSSNYLSTVDNQFYLLTRNDAVTQQIKPNDKFKLGIYNYQIESLPDDISNPGLLLFKLSYSQVAQESHTYTVDIQNKDTTLYVNDTLTLDVICTDNLQQVTSPTLTYQSSSIEVATVLNGIVTCVAEGTTVITVTFNGVSDTLNLTVQTEQIQDNYTISITGDSTVKLNSNITLNASVYNNGVLDSSKSVVWNVYNQDQSSNQYLSIVSQDGSSIVLKATNNSSYVGRYVVVKASKDGDSSIYKEHVVQIKALF
jgi:hypothetical protein